MWRSIPLHLHNFVSLYLGYQFNNAKKTIMSNFKGLCYAAFPKGYAPDTANQTCVYQSSDIAAKFLAPIWGDGYMTSSGDSCSIHNEDPKKKARNDIETMAEMGVELIRLYDWDPENDHSQFLKYCFVHNIDVLVSVSNYFLQSEGMANLEDLIPKLIKSFTDAHTNDYHQAIKGIVIGNEADLPGNNITVDNLIRFTTRFAEIEMNEFNAHREVLIGHPMSFAMQQGAKFPCFGIWDAFIPTLKNVSYKNLSKRLFLAPQTYNNANYLFENAEASGKGYIDQAFDRYQLPILITEIGQSRKHANFGEIVSGQIKSAIDYHEANPNKLIGLCFFQFADKPWLSSEDTEANFGIFSQSDEVICKLQYGDADFKIKRCGCCSHAKLEVNAIKESALHHVVVDLYKAGEEETHLEH